MTRLITFLLAILLFSSVLFVEGSASPKTPRKFDEFGDINCEDEMARLDNFAIQLQNQSSATGFIIFYGGRRFRGRLPKRGEAAARASRLKPYLVERRGVPTSRVIVIDGGYAEQWLAELWINPAGMQPPQPLQSLPIEKIKFRKGKARARDFRCRI
jgi:hypothetical protein